MGLVARSESVSESVNILFLEIHPFKRLHLKMSPSQLRKEKRRNDERITKKEDSAKVSEIVNPESPIFKCDFCEATFKSEKKLENPR